MMAPMERATSSPRLTSGGIVGDTLARAVSWSAGACAALVVEQRWRTPFEAAAHGLPAPLIVSLTSYGPRLSSVHLTLKCLLRQSVKPDAVMLWLTESDLRSAPETVRDLVAEGITIGSSEDLRSFKKIIPTLQARPEAFVVTADDDVYYHAGWLEELVHGFSKNDGAIVCRRAHQIPFASDGALKPYTRWPWSYETDRVTADILPVGAGGVLFPPGSLAPEVLDASAFMQLCPTADDLWLYWMARKAGSRFKKVSDQRTYFYWPRTQDVGLANTNRRAGANDVQIRRMIERYGFPPLDQ